MKINKYFSIISILFTLVAVLIKVQLDIHTYQAFQQQAPATDFTPIGLIDGSSNFTAIILLIISFVFTIMGIEKKNKYRYLSLTFGIIALFYILVPFGLFLVRM